MEPFVIYCKKRKPFIKSINGFDERCVKLSLRVVGLLNQVDINLRSLYEIKKIETFEAFLSIIWFYKLNKSEAMSGRSHTTGSGSDSDEHVRFDLL